MTDAIDKIAEQIVFEAVLDEIEREEMPQIDGDQVAALKDHFEDMGVLVTQEHIDPAELNPIQEDYDEDKVEGIISEIEEEEEMSAILVSEDYYILDGHHRALAARRLNERGRNVKLPIVRVHQERDDALQACMDFERRVEEGVQDMDHVVVMADRFQPFHKGHYEDYKKLESRFGKNNVYVITSNRTQPIEAPFTFEEKRRMMTRLYGIPASQIVEVENAYNPEEVLEDRDSENTCFVMALNEGDIGALNESEISEYFERYDPSDLQGYEETGYVYEIEHEPLRIKENEVPDKNVQKVFADESVSERTKKAFFQEVFGTFDSELFELVNDKFTEGPLNVELVEAFVESQGQSVIQEFSKTAFVDVDDGPTTWWEGMDERADAHEKLAEQMGLQIMRYLGDQNNYDLKRDGLGFPSFYPSGRSQEEEWNFGDPESLYREFSSLVATAAGYQALDWLGLEHAQEVMRHEDFDDIVDKLFGQNMEGDDGPIADVLDRVRSQQGVVTESKDKKKVMAEGGGAFDDTVDVPADKTPQIFDEFIEHLEQVPEVTTEKVAGLGSTRQILQDLPGKKPKSGDIDLLTVTANVPTNEATDALENHFDKVGMENKSFFGNIFSVAFETEHHEAPVQIDLMLAEPDEDDRVFRYLRDLKFFSGEEWDPDRDFLLKGLHRTELIRRITKAVGLSMAREGFAVYKWNPSHDSYKSLMQRLENKLSRTRKKSNKEDLRNLIEFLRRFDSLRGVRRALFDENGFLEEKFLANRLRAGPVFGKYASKVIEKELAEKRSLKDHDWEKVFQQFLGAGPNVKQRLQTFQGVLDFVREQYESPEGLSQDRIEDAFRVYKQALEKDGYWSEGLRDMILDTLPFLDGVV